MSHLLLYATQNDGELIRAWLNTEPDIAWIISDGPGRWRASDTIAQLQAGSYSLWHVGSGTLPLFATLDDDRPQPISDPWLGWTALVSGKDSTAPWFDHYPGVLSLGFFPDGNPLEPDRGSPGYMGVSQFGWIGDHFRSVGGGAESVTKRWWARLRRWVGSVAVRVIGAVPVNSQPLPIMAFPEAFRIIERGEARRYRSNYRPA